MANALLDDSMNPDLDLPRRRHTQVHDQPVSRSAFTSKDVNTKIKSKVAAKRNGFRLYPKTDSQPSHSQPSTLTRTGLSIPNMRRSTQRSRIPRPESTSVGRSRPEPLLHQASVTSAAMDVDELQSQDPAYNVAMSDLIKLAMGS